MTTEPIPRSDWEIDLSIDGKSVVRISSKDEMEIGTGVNLHLASAILGAVKGFIDSRNAIDALSIKSFVEKMYPSG